MTNEPFEVADPSGLTDADWAEINKLRNAYKAGGKQALKQAFKELSKDAVRYVRVVGAFYPIETRETIKDAMAERGITEEDLREIMRKHSEPLPETNSRTFSTPRCSSVPFRYPID